MITALIAVSLGLPQGNRPTGEFTLLGRPAPKISVKSTAGFPIKSSTLARQNTVLFVFCACDECRRVAKEWARRQKEPFFHRNGKPFASTLVVYAGEKKAATAFEKSIRFDAKSTTVAYDPDLTVARSFRAMPCPSVYVVDPKQVVRYSSKEFAPSRETSPTFLVGQTLNLLTAIGNGPVASPPSAAEDTSVTLPAGPSLTPVKEGQLDLLEDHGVHWQPRDIVGTFVQHTFTFRNDEKVPVEIARFQASCGCSGVKLTKDGAEVSAAVVKPGETIQVAVTAEVGDGAVAKVVQVWLYSKSDQSVGFIKMTLDRKAPTGFP